MDNYDLNIEAYGYFIKIEIGIREFLISIIRNKNILNWSKSFLGDNQKETIAVVINRILEANKNNEVPNIEDVYIQKLSLTKKQLDDNFPKEKLCHPFYYLNWTDMESLLSNKSNSILIQDSIGKLNKECIVRNLKMLNGLRNDIAHSRFISKNELSIIKGSYLQISGLIPDFDQLVTNQTKESNPKEIFNDLSNSIEIVLTNNNMTINNIENVISSMDLCINSFWINSLYNDIISDAINLKNEMIIYKEFKQKSGGILEILKWNDRNKEALNNLKMKLVK